MQQLEVSAGIQAAILFMGTQANQHFYGGYICNFSRQQKPLIEREFFL